MAISPLDHASAAASVCAWVTQRVQQAGEFSARSGREEYIDHIPNVACAAWRRERGGVHECAVSWSGVALEPVGKSMNRSAVGWGDTPYRFGRIFQARGFGAKRLAKKRLRLMQAADEEVQSMLSESEKVEFVSWGVEHSFVEQYFMGLCAHFINRRSLVFTNRRILMFQIDSRWKVSGLKSQVRYRAITKVARGGLGTIGLVLRDGSKLCATGLPRKDRKPVKALVSGELQAIRADASGLGRNTSASIADTA
jgi:hypothetical protein